MSPVKWMLVPVGGEYYDLDRNNRRILTSVSQVEAEKFVRGKMRPGDVIQKTEKDGYITPWKIRSRAGVR